MPRSVKSPHAANVRASERSADATSSDDFVDANGRVWSNAPLLQIECTGDANDHTEENAAFSQTILERQREEVDREVGNPGRIAVPASSETEGQSINSAQRIICMEIPTPGLTDYGSGFESDEDAFRLLVDDAVISAIVSATNRKGGDRAAAHANAAVALAQINARDAGQFGPWYSTHKTVAGKVVRAQLRTERLLSPNALLMLTKRLDRCSRWTPVDSDEVLALIGFHLLVGARQGKRSAVRDIFSVRSKALLAFPAAALAMSSARMKSVNSVLSFALSEREATLRAAGERLAKCADVYERIRLNFQRAYSPQRNLVVDEQLVGFRGKFVARQYMPSKPDKVGIKQWLLVDSSLYTYNMQVYTGREGARVDGRERGQAERVVMDMVAPLQNGAYELTTDRFFTKLETAERLRREKGISLLGTMRIDNRSLPPALRAVKTREAKSSIYAYSAPFTLLSYCQRAGKIVPLFSSRHPGENGTPAGATDAETQESSLRSRKPRMVLDYNSTKGFVDTVDKMTKGYTAQRATRKWHHSLFWRTMDLAALNAFVMDSTKRTEQGKGPRRRLDFLLSLAEALIKRNALKRLSERRLPRQRRADIARFYDVDVHVEATQAAFSQLGQQLPRRRCALCPRGTNNKTRYACGTCRRFACRSHAAITYSVECAICARTASSADSGMDTE